MKSGKQNFLCSGCLACPDFTLRYADTWQGIFKDDMTTSYNKAEAIKRAVELEQRGDFADGKKFSVLLADGRFFRASMQDGAETILLCGDEDATISYADHYVESYTSSNEFSGLAWPQS